jgi:hypothetical protein
VSDTLTAFACLCQPPVYGRRPFGTKNKVTDHEMLVFNPHCTVFDRVFCTLWVDKEIKLTKKISFFFLKFLAARYDFLKF